MATNEPVDYEKLYLSSELSDLTLKFNEGKLPAHRIILATRNKVFHSMFAKTNNVKNNVTQVIKISNSNIETFKVFLKYYYMNKVDDKEITMDLLITANEYSEMKLRLLCETKLTKDINQKNVVDTLDSAMKHKCENLKTGALEFISKNYFSFMKNHSYLFETVNHRRLSCRFNQNYYEQMKNEILIFIDAALKNASFPLVKEKVNYVDNNVRLDSFDKKEYLKFNSKSPMKKTIHTLDLNWIVESNIDENFVLLIYPQSTHFLSCDAVFEVIIKAPSKETKILQKLNCKFDKNNTKYRINLGPINLLRNYETHIITKTRFAYTFELEIAIQMSNIKRKY